MPPVIVPPDKGRYECVWSDLDTVIELPLRVIVLPEIEELPLCSTVFQELHVPLS